MMDWSKELEIIFNDPLLADVTAPKKHKTSSDRLIAGFQDISDFYEANGKLPDEESNQKLYHYLKGILSSEAKIDKCLPYDRFGILAPSSVLQEPENYYSSKDLSIDEELERIMDDPLMSEAVNDDEQDIFDIPEYMRVRLAERKEADYVGKRKPCEDFNRFVEGFNEVHSGLKSGKFKLVKFSVKHLQVGRYFIEDGIIGFLAAFEDQGINKHGDRDGRTRVIYENGTESDIKYKTITKNLSVTGYSIVDCSDWTDEDYKQKFTLCDDDVESGTIYVLRSKSVRPEIKAIKNLYKIGFTVTSVESRIANAKNEPTYLCDDVEVVATWKVYNVKSSTFEALIHKLFDGVKLQITVDGHHPKEWFVVPLNIIEEALIAIIEGKAIEYNPQLQKIIYC